MASFGFEGGALRPIAWAALIAVELALAVAVVLGSDAAAYAAAGADAAVRGAHRRRDPSRQGRRALCLLRTALHGLLARRAAQPRAGGGVRG